MQKKKIELTAEQKKLIGNYCAYSIGDQITYTLKAHKELPDELKATFHLKTFKGIDALNFVGKINSQESPAKINIDICKEHIISYTNLVDDKGYIHDSESVNGKITIESLNNLRGEIIAEIAEVIISSSTISEEESLGLA